MKRSLSQWLRCGLAFTLSLATPLLLAKDLAKEVPNPSRYFLDAQPNPESTEWRQIPALALLIDKFGLAVRASGAVRLDVNALVKLRGAKINGEAQNAPLILRLPGRESDLEWKIDYVDESVPGTTTYVGQINGEDATLLTVATDGKDVLGKFHLDSSTFVVAGSGSTFGIVEVEKTLVKQVPETWHQTRSSVGKKLVTSSSSQTTSKTLPTNGTTRVLFLYSSEVAVSQGNVSLFVASIVAEANATLRTSGVPAENYFSVAGVQQLATDIPDNFDPNAVIDVMDQRSGIFEDVDDWMDAASADLAFVLIGTNDDPQGTETLRLGGASLGWDPDSPFGVSTDAYALGDLTAVHELGHLVGGHHSVGELTADISAGAEEDSRGHVLSTTFMTMMGGYVNESNNDDYCPFVTLNDNPTCIRLPRWSSPSISYLGVPTGVSDVSDMVRALPIQTPTVAGYHTYGTSRPSTPSGLSAQREWCYGSNQVSWSAASETTEYQLFRSTSSGFTNPVLIYQGASTDTFIEVPPAGWYLQLRACNGSGCSANTSNVFAQYYNGCL